MTLWRNTVFYGLLLVASCAFGATYYIDPQNGNDSADGLSTNTAWHTIPGTRTADDTADYQTQWGPGPTVSRTAKVPSGTVFLLKSGSVFNSTNAGKIYISNRDLDGPPYLGYSYYQDSCLTNPVVFRRDTNWGVGPVAFDGTNCVYTDTTGCGFFYMRNLCGTTFDGVAGVGDPYSGFVVSNTWDTAFFYWMANTNKGGGDYLIGPTNRYLRLFNCGTRLVDTNGNWESHGAFVLTMDTSTAKTYTSCEIGNVEVHNNGLYGTGIRFGEQPGRVTNGWVHDVLIHDSGPYDWDGTNKVGRGLVFKNSQVVISNAVTYHMTKGQDHGMPLISASDPVEQAWTVRIVDIAPVCYSNWWQGLNHNGCYGAKTGQWLTNLAEFYEINALVYDNGGPGMKIYGGPYNFYVVGCTLYSNVDNILAHPGDSGDTNQSNVYIYNTASYAPNPFDGNLAVGYWVSNTMRFVWHADFNSYLAANPADASESFSQWSCYAGSAPYTPENFVYGANGPGWASGAWYGYMGWHNDSHSRGTGAADSSLAPFVNMASRNFALSSHYAGTNLSAMPWYLPAMSYDRTGAARTSWDIGANEATASPAPPLSPLPSAPPGRRRAAL